MAWNRFHRIRYNQEKRYPPLNIPSRNVLNFLVFQIHPELFQIPGEIIRRVLRESPVLQVRVVCRKRLYDRFIATRRLNFNRYGRYDAFVGFALK